MQFQWFYSGSFAYDGAGNPTTFKGTSQGFNANNQQTSNGTFVYDGNGNPTTYRGSGFTFDPENRATAIGATWTAGYRADGLRGWKNVGGVKTYYLYDQGEPVVELSAAGAVQATNVLAPDGLVARQQSGTWTQYTFDQQGNVAQRLNSSQVVTSSSTYDAYGIESSSGTPTDVFGYNARWGYLLDRETGLYLCQRRFYDRGTGRWVNRDPIGSAGSINIYSYCSGSPDNHFDITGKKMSQEECAQLLAKIGRKQDDLMDDLLTYDPIDDGRGGWPKAGGGPTRVGGHYGEIRQRQHGIIKDLMQYATQCGDDNNYPDVPQVCYEHVPISIPKPDWKWQNWMVPAGEILIGGAIIGGCMLAPEVCIAIVVVGAA